MMQGVLIGGTSGPHVAPKSNEVAAMVRFSRDGPLATIVPGARASRCRYCKHATCGGVQARWRPRLSRSHRANHL